VYYTDISGNSPDARWPSARCVFYFGFISPVINVHGWDCSVYTMPTLTKCQHVTHSFNTSVLAHEEIQLRCTSDAANLIDTNLDTDDITCLLIFFNSPDNVYIRSTVSDIYNTGPQHYTYSRNKQFCFINTFIGGPAFCNGKAASIKC